MAHRPLRLHLDGEALVANWRWLRECGGAAACGAAVKADGYGLGAREVVKRLADAGCRDFFVSTWAEAEALMPWSEGLNLSVLHGVGAEDMDAALASPARPVLNSPAQVARWAEAGAGRPCDVMIDTGMNRLGLSPGEARSGLLDELQVATLMSHLACADEPDHPLNGRQLAAFRALCEHLPAERYSLANSAGICLGREYAFGLTRPGLALYGGIPVPGCSAQEAGIRPVVAIEAQVIQVRRVPAGATIGYNATYVAPEDINVAILNMGYADGYLRQLGDVSFAYTSERWLPIVGRISMDLIAVHLPDETQFEAIQIGQGTRPTLRVELRGGAGVRVGGAGISSESRKLPAVDVAEGDWLGLHFDLPYLGRGGELSQYELLTILGSRFERVWS